VDKAPETHESVCPPRVQEFADQTVRYVYAALQVEITYDSETLPLVDHYLRSVPETQGATVALVVSTAGAYFGEVVRRRLGGHWDLGAAEPTGWRLVLPGGTSIAPAGMVASVIVRHDELEDMDTGFDVPARLQPAAEMALARMSEVSEDEYYSLCGRLDTLEHLQEVLVGFEAERKAAEEALSRAAAGRSDEEE
jgi:hypothetical protein